MGYACRPFCAYLPRFVEPAFLKPAAPFDSDRHFFELKWDGMRTLAFCDASGVRLVNRRRNDVTIHYPELVDALGAVPAGTVLDGELVVMNGGRPDLASMLARQQVKAPLKVRVAAQRSPAAFVAFDQLYRLQAHYG